MIVCLSLSPSLPLSLGEMPRDCDVASVRVMSSNLEEIEIDDVESDHCWLDPLVVLPTELLLYQ